MSHISRYEDILLSLMSNISNLKRSYTVLQNSHLKSKCPILSKCHLSIVLQVSG